MLSGGVLRAIYAHADEGYPEEVCGLVFAERAAHGYPHAAASRCENRARAPRTAFELSVADLVVLDESLRTPRPARIVYHSHVEVGAYLSGQDRAAAAPNGASLYPVDHLVVDARAGGARGARLYRFIGGTFVEIAAFEA